MTMPMGDTGPQAQLAGATVLEGPIWIVPNVGNQAGVSTGTLTNAPAATNPNFWLGIYINGVLRKIPCW
jgi:hypothetical protein